MGKAINLELSFLEPYLLVFEFAPLLFFMNMNNLSIGSWNVNGLGDKYRDDQFMSCLKYDINILIETWKGVDDTSTSISEIIFLVTINNVKN